MSSALGIFRSNGDPSSVGLTADIGQLARDILTGFPYVKVGSLDTEWRLASMFFGASFQGIAVQTFTATGANTYTPDALMKYCLVISTGAGGGGGGADTDGGAGITAAGAGGGAGGTCIELFTIATIFPSQTVTIGTGGTAGANTGGNGGAGGDTTFGALHTANGGSGGTGSGTSTTTSTEPFGGNGGSASGGTVNIAGGGGSYAYSVSSDGTTDFSLAVGGYGGVSFWGGGGRQVALAKSTLSPAAALAGSGGSARGSGGTGAVCINTTSGTAGGAGANGLCVVIEFLGAA